MMSLKDQAIVQSSYILSVIYRWRWDLAGLLDASHRISQWQLTLWGLAQERGDRRDGVCERLQSDPWNRALWHAPTAVGRGIVTEHSVWSLCWSVSCVCCGVELGSDQLVRLNATPIGPHAFCKQLRAEYHMHEVEWITWLGAALQQYHQPESCQCCIFSCDYTFSEPRLAVHLEQAPETGPGTEHMVRAPNISWVWQPAEVLLGETKNTIFSSCDNTCCPQRSCTQLLSKVLRCQHLPLQM